MWAGHGTCSYICVYTNAVASSIELLLYLWHDFYNMVFEIKHTLCIASGLGTHPPSKKFWVCASLCLKTEPDNLYLMPCGCSAPISLAMIQPYTQQTKNCMYLNLLQVNVGCSGPCATFVSTPHSVSLLSHSPATKPQSSVSMPWKTDV